jgi:hypothetical protein
MKSDDPGFDDGLCDEAAATPASDHLRARIVAVMVAMLVAVLIIVAPVRMRRRYIRGHGLHSH